MQYPLLFVNIFIKLREKCGKEIYLTIVDYMVFNALSSTLITNETVMGKFHGRFFWRKFENK